MSKKVLEIDFQGTLNLPVAAFPPFKLRSSMVDKDPVIWVHLIEVYIQYVQTLLQLHQPINERSEEQLCLFVRSYLREIGNEQGQLLSLGLINVQIVQNLNTLKIWILELIKQYGVISLKLNGSSLWDFARIYTPKNSKLVRGIIDGTFKPKSKNTISSISLVQKHIEHLVTNGKFDDLDLKMFATLMNEKNTFSTSKNTKSSKVGKEKSIGGNKRKSASFSENFVTVGWLEVLESIYSDGKGRFAKQSRDLAVISLLAMSTAKVASLISALNISSFRTLTLYPLVAGIITSTSFKASYPDLKQKLPFLKAEPSKKSPVDENDVKTLIELFPSLTIKYTEKLLRKNDLNVERVTNLLLENPDLAVPKESDNSNERHVYQSDDKDEVFITKKVNIKQKEHVPDEHKNKTLTAALRLMYEADEDERDDTYDEAEVANVGAAATEATKTDKVEMYLWDLFKKDQAIFDRSSRNSRQRKEMKNETSWSDEQIEGWAKMIQRSPKRAKLLEEKYMFKGNKPWRSSFNRNQGETIDAASNETSREQTPDDNSSSRRNNQNKNQKDGDNPKSEANKNSAANAKKSQARNERNKASKANHNRKSGHDKKMSKGF